MDCLFCSIEKGQIPATILYRDEKVLAFEDIHPQAPLHLVIIPLKHIATLNDIASDDHELIGHMVQTAQHLAKTHHVAESGYRTVMNCNAGGGQTIFHIHLHLLGGRQLQWPPG